MDGKFLSWWGKGWQNFRLEMMWEVFDILFHVIYSKNMEKSTLILMVVTIWRLQV